MKTLKTKRMIIRDWTLEEEDRAFFHYIMSNIRGRLFYPARLLRMDADALLETIVNRAESRAVDWQLACLKKTGQRLGFVGLAEALFEAPFNPSIEIGWQFDPEVWGNGYATEAAKALLAHGFQDLELTEILAFAVPENKASTAVMTRIGMSKVNGGDFNHPSVPDTHPHLKHHVLYSQSAKDWRVLNEVQED